MSESSTESSGSRDVDMMGKRKRTYEESTEEKGQNHNQAINAVTINAMEDWFQKTEPKGSIDQWSVKAKPLVMADEDARSDDSTAT